MIRILLLALAAGALVAAPAAVHAKSKADAENADSDTPRKSRSKRDSAKDTTKSKDDDEAKPDKASKRSRGKEADRDKDRDGGGSKGGGKGKPVQVGTFGSWGAFTAAQGKGKTCYALTQPRERAPAEAKRESAYVFISNRPNEKVRQEVSIIMGFPMKDNSNAKAEIGGASFDLICKGTNAWLENPEKEAEFIETMKRGSKLVIKASAARGGLTTDSYSLAGLSDALARVQKDCP